ncbi:rhomboid family intramembrane serine protease [Rhodobacteraceae bacterium WD3A24]|nr:rhomboid family intramembrane serine protease [Rhodobacteraceae bacterium WD3A24]
MRRPVPLGPMPTVPNAPMLIWLVGLTCVPEIVLTLSESGLIGLDGLRRQATLFGAFWTGLFRGWEPLFPGQHLTMFVTYALLHGGLMHLIGNMIVTLALGGIAVARLGQWGFLLLYVLSAVGGGAGFALLSASDTPMVGASGAVFGLAGAWKYWEWQARRAAHADMMPLWRSLAGLALVNVLLWLALSGLLAWQAHLGGFVTGWVFAAAVTPPLRRR